MNREEHLLTITAEECGEVAQRLTKILRFGVFETQPGNERDNNSRFYQELADLLAMVEMLEDEGITAKINPVLMTQWKMNKKKKVEHFLEYSKEQGTLE